MKRIALISSPELSRALTSRGAEVVTGDSVRSAISAITPRLRDGTIDIVLLVCSDERAASMVDVWARSLASFVPTRFVGVGEWGSAQVSLDPGCSLARLLEELDLEAAAGDEDVTVSVDGGLSRHQPEPGADSAVEIPEAPTWAAGRGQDSQRSEPVHAWMPPTDAATEEIPRIRTQADAPAASSQNGGAQNPDPATAEPRPTPAPPVETTDEPVTRASSPAAFDPWGAPRPRVCAPDTRERVPSDSDWSHVIFLVSGRGGVGRSATAINIAEQAADRLKRNVVLVDANVGQGGLATNLRVARGGAPSTLPTIADLVAGASVQRIVSGSEAVRGAGGASVAFASVLAPDPDQATPEASSPQHYRRVIDLLAPVSDLLVVDTCVSWQRDPTGIASGLIAPGLRAGANALVVTDASLEGMDGARRLVRWATRLAPGRVAGLLNMSPASAAPDLAAAGKLFNPVPCLAVVPYDETVRLRAAKGQPVHRLLSLAADKVLAHLGIG